MRTAVKRRRAMGSDDGMGMGAVWSGFLPGGFGEGAGGARVCEVLLDFESEELSNGESSNFISNQS